MLNPFNGDKAGEVPKDSVEDVGKAVESALSAKKKAFNTTPYERYTILRDLAEEVRSKKREYARTISTESGKPIGEGLGEVGRAYHTFMLSAEFSRMIEGETIPIQVTECVSKKRAYTVREPVGTVGAITPFNFPLALVAHKVGPALAAGNTVVLKPAPQTPLSAMMMAEDFGSCGLPPGFLNVVNGDVETGEALVKSEVDMITFTGSVEAGQSITRNAGIKKIGLELGGNDPLIVMDDADVEEAASIAVDGAFGNAGQRCTSIKRLLLSNEIADDFIKIFISKTQKLVVGDPLEEKTDVGSVISEDAARMIIGRVEKAVEDGAKILLGGKKMGAVVEPTILDMVSPESMLVRKETFGPLAPIMRFDTIEEAVELSNSTEYGLQAGVYTNSIRNMDYFSDNLDVGAVIINGPPGFRVESIPFGGVKKSGVGREGVKYAIEEMTRIKTTVR